MASVSVPVTGMEYAVSNESRMVGWVNGGKTGQVIEIPANGTVEVNEKLKRIALSMKSGGPAGRRGEERPKERQFTMDDLKECVTYFEKVCGDLLPT